MRRLSATLLCDVRLQWRNGFYWAVAFLLAALLVLVSQLPVLDWRPVLAPLVFGNLVTATFFFAIGLVLKPMTEELGWSRTELSSAVTVFMIVTAASRRRCQSGVSNKS